LHRALPRIVVFLLRNAVSAESIERSTAFELKKKRTLSRRGKIASVFVGTRRRAPALRAVCEAAEIVFVLSFETPTPTDSASVIAFDCK
jgi:hypothetical protein